MAVPSDAEAASCLSSSAHRSDLHGRQTTTARPSVTPTSYVTSREKRRLRPAPCCPFVCALPVLLTAALWCSQQLTPFLAALPPAGSPC